MATDPAALGSDKETKRIPILMWVVAAVLIVSAIMLRFDGLNRHFVWNDEAYTLMHVSGYTRYEIGPLIEEDITPFGIVRYQFQTGLSHRPFSDVWKSLSTEPEHAPGYYVLAWLWGKVFGWDPGVMRSLSAIIGLIQIPAAFWLGCELCGTVWGGVLAAILIGLSPLQVEYGQELREYSLYASMFLLSSASFLKAKRTNDLGLGNLFLMPCHFIQFDLAALLFASHTRFLSSCHGAVETI